MTDPTQPQHYKSGKVECLTCIEAATCTKPGIEAFYVGNVIKYLWRYDQKNGLEDVKKSQVYLEKLIKFLEEKNENDNPKN